MLSNVGAIKSCVTGINEEVKAYKMKKAATHVRGTAALKADMIKTRMNEKQKEVRTLITEVKTSLDEIASHLLDEKDMLTLDIKLLLLSIILVLISSTSALIIFIDF